MRSHTDRLIEVILHIVDSHGFLRANLEPGIFCNNANISLVGPECEFHDFLPFFLAFSLCSHFSAFESVGAENYARRTGPYMSAHAINCRFSANSHSSIAINIALHINLAYGARTWAPAPCRHSATKCASRPIKIERMCPAFYPIHNSFRLSHE